MFIHTCEKQKISDSYNKCEPGFIINTLPYIDDRSGFQSRTLPQRSNKILFPLMKQWEKMTQLWLPIIRTSLYTILQYSPHISDRFSDIIFLYKISYAQS